MNERNTLRCDDCGAFAIHSLLTAFSDENASPAPTAGGLRPDTKSCVLTF